MSVSFEGIGERAVTFETVNDVNAGAPVKMSANGKVALCGTGERMCGIALYVAEDGCASVQLGGYVNVSYTGTAPAVGYARMIADGNGGVKVDSEATGGEYLVTDVDENAKTVGFFM